MTEDVGDCAGMNDWLDHWDALSDEDKAVELRAMDDYVEYTRTLSEEERS